MFDSRCWVILTYIVLWFSGFLTAGSSLCYFHEWYQVQLQGSTLLRLLLQGSRVTVTSCRLSRPAIVFILSWHFLSSFPSVALFLWFQVFDSFLGSSFPFWYLSPHWVSRSRWFVSTHLKSEESYVYQNHLILPRISLDSHLSTHKHPLNLNIWFFNLWPIINKCIYASLPQFKKLKFQWHLKDSRDSCVLNCSVVSNSLWPCGP